MQSREKQTLKIWGNARLLQCKDERKHSTLEMCPSCYDLLILQRKSKRKHSLHLFATLLQESAQRSEASLVSAWKTNAMNAALDSHARLESNSDKLRCIACSSAHASPKPNPHTARGTSQSIHPVQSLRDFNTSRKCTMRRGKP